MFDFDPKDYRDFVYGVVSKKFLSKKNSTFLNFGMKNSSYFGIMEKCVVLKTPVLTMAFL
jgi:hypothetical protein